MNKTEAKKARNLLYFEKMYDIIKNNMINYRSKNAKESELLWRLLLKAAFTFGTIRS